VIVDPLADDSVALKVSGTPGFCVSMSTAPLDGSVSTFSVFAQAVAERRRAIVSVVILIFVIPPSMWGQPDFTAGFCTSRTSGRNPG
jgi:hypothetical protein